MPFSGEKLRELREKRGIGRDELAATVGTSRQYISHLENGLKLNPAFDLVEKLAGALGVTCLAFIADAPPVEKPVPPASAGRPRNTPAKGKAKK